MKLLINSVEFPSVLSGACLNGVSLLQFVLDGWFGLCLSQFMRLWQATLNKFIISPAWGR